MKVKRFKSGPRSNYRGGHEMRFLHKKLTKMTGVFVWPNMVVVSTAVVIKRPG